MNKYREQALGFQLYPVTNLYRLLTLPGNHKLVSGKQALVEFFETDISAWEAVVSSMAFSLFSE